MSLGTLLFATAVVAGGTGAFFSDTETSPGNVFTAGAIDLQIDHTMATYNGENCVTNCEPVGQNLIENGSFESPLVQANGGSHEFFAGIPDWTLEAGSFVEVQRNAFASADGLQHLELDGDGAEPATTISQEISTIPGERYRLSFQHSPRPQNQAAGSGILFEVEVVSPGGTTFSDAINTGSGPVNWSTHTYEFIAGDTVTTIRFAYDGTVNTFGGLLDAVEVVQLSCTDGQYENTPGGYCELWDAKDLETETFFNFSDVKPQDSGSNLVSLHVDDNDAFLCLYVDEVEDAENDNLDPEVAAGDTTSPEGELGTYLQVRGWYSDELGNEFDEAFGPTPIAELDGVAYADSDTTQPAIPGDTTEYLKLEWCLGEFLGDGSCDGDFPVLNQTQTDSFLADVRFYAVQSRNNPDFQCEAVDIP